MKINETRMMSFHVICVESVQNANPCGFEVYGSIEHCESGYVEAWCVFEQEKE